MAKRFLDTNFFKSPFVRGLEAPLKLLYGFIICDCSNAGIWTVDFEIASVYCGLKIEPEKAKKSFIDNGKIIDLNNGKWFIPDFIEHQYSKGLQEKNPAHNSIISELKQYNLLEKDLTIKKMGATKPPLRPSKGSKVMDKEKEVVKEKDKEIQDAKISKEKSLHVQFREIFISEYQRQKNMPFIWATEAGKHGKHLNGIIAQITELLQKKEGETTDKSKTDFFKVLLNNLPEWYQQNGFSPAVINTKFNEIIDKINSRNGKHKPIDDEEFARFAAAGAAHYGAEAKSS